MKKFPVVLALAGAATLGLNAHYELSKYSRDQIWANQTTMVERFVRGPPNKIVSAEFLRAAKARRVEDLRAGLNDLKTKGADQSEYCRFQLKFDAVTRNRGNVDAAEAEISRRSFKPYSECDSDVRLHNFETKGLNISGAGAFLLGFGSMVVSLFRRIFSRKKP